jgi:hypothetical protein
MEKYSFEEIDYLISLIRENERRGGAGTAGIVPLLLAIAEMLYILINDSRRSHRL